ncbi:hypothetical protein C8R41DRAFT_916641 [Lentinula lateritia]|uniref:Uncharacterized protein n=1 Tax=Lentinula lateritia TaxID=40482 RepID=A0ABQ8VPS3_9AGAR|nr:hypothetical protein C8R41DRAFT_916641 [Lentinula lateritia]
MPLPPVSNPAPVEGFAESVVAMFPHIQQSEQSDVTESSKANRVQDKDFCSGSSDYSLLSVHHERAPIFSTSSSVPTTDESQTSDHALTASPIPQHGLATSSPVSSEMNHDAESQSMLSDASIPDNSSKRYPSPNTDSESLRTGIETFIQDSQPPKDNHLRVAIHGGKPSLSTVLFVQKKVKAKDAWTRSFILKAASMVDHPPDFELPRGSGPLCPNDLFVCVDLSLWHKGEDVLSANTISSSTTSSSAPSSSIASSRNDSLHWSDPSMSQYLRIWCWTLTSKCGNR